VLDRNSGQAFATMAGEMWDGEAQSVSAMVRSRGNQIDTISEAEKANWIKATEGVHTGWIEQMKGRNIDGAALIAQMRALVAKHDRAA
jgi:hypothetical protein